MLSKIFKVLRFSYEYTLDCLATMRFNNYSPLETRDRRLYYHILIDTHAIEKGLCLPNSRPLFGKQKIQGLIRMANLYNPDFSSFPIQMLNGALRTYLESHHQRGITDDEILKQIDSYLQESAKGSLHELPELGGTKDATNVYRDPPPTEELVNFLTSRFSCRTFDSQPLDREVIEQILKVSQSTPSQCNRQSTRVHFYSDREQINRLLELQGGSNGFRQDIGNLFVVSSEITAWGGPGQRNQAFVDGALFCMTLMLTCHAHRVATCPLNLAKLNSDEKRIKQEGDIPARERLIMMIGLGKARADQVVAACSPRLPLERVASFH